MTALIMIQLSLESAAAAAAKSESDAMPQVPFGRDLPAMISSATSQCEQITLPAAAAAATSVTQQRQDAGSRCQ